jgi:hypothetical protein
MGNSPCCCKDDNPDIEVKVKDVYCCDNIQSSCCIKTEKKHHRHRSTTLKPHPPHHPRHNPKLDPHH